MYVMVLQIKLVVVVVVVNCYVDADDIVSIFLFQFKTGSFLSNFH